MEFQRDIAPPPAEKPVEVVEQERPRQTRVGGMSFSEALAKVEAHRGRVQGALAFAMLARIIADFDILALIREPDQLVHELPLVGLALLSYMIVLWFLAARTRDRWGFGMALGIGVLQATYMIVVIVVGTLWTDPMQAWRPALAAVTHLALAFTAFRAGGSYPPLDSKKPWVFGFLTAFIFVVIPWFAEPLAEVMGWQW
jgi:hypothetical protein